MYDTSQIETPFLEVRDLELWSDGVSLISVPELSLKCTSITVIMGSNGAGKSLLLRLMHGLIQPAQGEISCWGTPLSPSTRRSQSLVFQTPVLLRRTTEANIRFVLKARGLDVRTSGELLERVGLAEKARTPARRLSGGERQRLAIAQALATKPKTLLLDEPTASLDPRSTAMIEVILRQTISLGTRILMVTHDAMQAKRMAEEVVFLSDGKVIEQSPAAQFFEKPKTEQARAYLAGRLSA